MNKDFHEQFQKMLENSETEKTPEKQEKEESKASPQPAPSPKKKDPLQEKTPPKKEQETPQEKERRKRIREKFFGGIKKKEVVESKKKHTFLIGLLIGIANILIIIGVVVLIRTFLVSPFSVVGNSMTETLKNGNLILVDKMSYRISNPNRGDIIVFYPPVEEYTTQSGLLCKGKRLAYLALGKDLEEACKSRDFFVKRIIGVPGDTIEIRERKVYVTPLGEKRRIEINEDFLDDRNKNYTCFAATRCNSQKDINGFSVEIPEGTVFVLGDNRTGSSDSRMWKMDGKDVPFVTYENISGKVQARFWPLTDMSFFSSVDLLGEKIK